MRLHPMLVTKLRTFFLQNLQKIENMRPTIGASMFDEPEESEEESEE